MPCLFITGGAGFIGSALIRLLLAHSDYHIVNIDKLTYAGNLDSLDSARHHPRHHFIEADIAARGAMSALFSTHRPCGVIHLAAESHVDRSIDAADDFIHTNIVGTFALLEAARDYWRQLDAPAAQSFRFHQVSTDEVFGSLSMDDAPFCEDTPYDPRSPYSASKAAADHLVRAWHHTYGLPVLITNCSNNYGPYQFPEKLIPLMILRALDGQPLPVYGQGKQVRDWLYVDDHAQALHCVFERGANGATYCIGGDAQRRNIDLVHELCAVLDNVRPRPDQQSYTQQITFVADRPGHDQRYAIDASRIQRELGWKPQVALTVGLRQTVDWYLHHALWLERVSNGAYRERLTVDQTPVAR
jgi:dTDP-glucose 4,6-dehydratase